MNTDITKEQRNFFRLVYTWMFFGLALSGVTAVFTAFNPDMAQGILGDRLVFDGLLVAEIVLVVVLAANMKKLPVGWAVALFLLYCVTSGLTLSVIFFVYALNSIISLFFVTSLVFFLMSLYGFFTDHDLTSWGHVLLFGLLGIILVSLVNLFLNSTAVEWAVNVAGVLIFTGLIAYDTQKLKALDEAGTVEGSDEEIKLSIYGALDLYLDFINLFLKLLALFGKRR